MLRLFNIVTLAMVLLVSAAHAQADRERSRNRSEVLDLILLGERDVDFRRERDTIDVNFPEEWYRDRRFRALQFTAVRNDIEIFRIRIRYLNGYTEEVQVNRTIPRNGQIQVNLEDERSYIRQIEMFYRSRPDVGGTARIRVYGQPTRVSGPINPPNRPGNDDWVRFGCREISIFSNDAERFNVGQQQGRFRSIMLRVRRGEIDVLDLRVFYSYGPPEDLVVGRRLRAGQEVGPLDLRGRDRAIERIEVLARTIVDPVMIVSGQQIQKGSLCVRGLQQQR
jgi:hypothetical protein